MKRMEGTECSNKEVGDEEEVARAYCKSDYTLHFTFLDDIPFCAIPNSGGDCWQFV